MYMEGSVMNKLDDPKFIGCLRHFLTTYQPVVSKRSENTISAYKDAIRLYLQWLHDKKKKDLTSVTADDFSQEKVSGFLSWLSEARNNTDTTLNQRLSHIKSFCRYLVNTPLNTCP